MDGKAGKTKLPRKLQNQLTEQARRFRQEPTPAEALLWEHLRNRKLGGLKFRRQVVIGRLIADFYCPAVKLVVEVDGEVHQKQQEEDLQREEVLRSLGCEIARFWNEEVMADVEFVLGKILEHSQK